MEAWEAFDFSLVGLIAAAFSAGAYYAQIGYWSLIIPTALLFGPLAVILKLKNEGRRSRAAVYLIVFLLVIVLAYLYEAFPGLYA